MFGKGLLKGLSITLREFFKKKVTVQYPEERCYIAPRFHGEFVFYEDKCITCGMCVNACPNEVIQLETDKADKKKFLTRFVLKLQYCLFCGLCVEACPKSAIVFSQNFEMAKYHLKSIPLVFVDRTPEQIAEEKDRLIAEAARAAEAKAKAAEAKARAEAAAAAKPESEAEAKPEQEKARPPDDGKAKGTEG